MVPLLVNAVKTTTSAPSLGYINRYNASGGGLTVTLPALAGLNVGARAMVQKYTLDGSINTVTFSRAGSDQFDDATTTFTLSRPGESRTIQVVSISGVKRWKITEAMSAGASVGTGAPLNVKDYGAVGDGVADDTAAIQATIAALPSVSFNIGGGVIYLPAGTYKITSTLSFGQNQSMIGASAGSVNLNYTGNSVCINVLGTGTAPESNGQFVDFTIQGYSGGSSAIGMQVGNMMGTLIERVGIWGFKNIGLYFKNPNTSTWAENNHVDVNLIQCATAVVFDTYSFDYSVYKFHVVTGPGQSCIALQNGAMMTGCQIQLRGNVNGNPTTNTGAVIAVDRGNTAGTSFMEGCTLDIAVELGGSGVGPYTILMGANTSNSYISAVGNMWFKDYGSPLFQGFSTAGAELKFAGFLLDPVLGSQDAFTIKGGLGRTQYRSLSFTAFNPMYIYPLYGEYQAFTLPNGAITISGFWEEPYATSRQVEILFRQPASGAAGTITWPSNVKWAGGVSALSSTNGYVDKVRLTYYPTEAKWYGEVLTHYS